MKILLTGQFDHFCLETSYFRALKEAGHKLEIFETKKNITKYIHFGKWGKLFHTFVPVQAWSKKSNRDFVIQAKKFQPDIIFVFANGEILPSSLAFLKSIIPVKVVLVWPDGLFNLGNNIMQSAPFYDLIASYSYTCEPVFKQCGFKHTAWIPLAADPFAHHEPFYSGHREFDISFVGGWRPEREEALATLIKYFPSAKLKIWGPYWKRSKNKSVHSHIIEKPLYGKEFTKIVQNSLINMNIIDETNYPAANMRFFEIPVAGGLQLASACPEMESTYLHNETVMYFHNKEELLNRVEFALSNREKCLQIAKHAQEYTLASHTYQHRIQEVIELLNK